MKEAWGMWTPSITSRSVLEKPKTSHIFALDCVVYENSIACPLTTSPLASWGK